jgi:hypothetical protein
MEMARILKQKYSVANREEKGVNAVTRLASSVTASLRIECHARAVANVINASENEAATFDVRLPYLQMLIPCNFQDMLAELRPLLSAVPLTLPVSLILNTSLCIVSRKLTR